jgi:ribonuclease HI
VASGLKKPEVTLYADGACLGNPGPGGFGVVLRYGDYERELSGGEPHTTNQRMELRAAIEGLKALRRPCRVRLHSDSAYLINCFKQRWYDTWEKNGWKNRDRKPVENRDLWEELVRLSRLHEIDWIKVRGHSGDPLNERCDELARRAAERFATSRASPKGSAPY